MLRRVADLVREHGDELLRLQALDNSVPLSFGAVYATSAAFVADVFDHHAGWADKLAGETLPPYQGGDHLVMTLREPVGINGYQLEPHAAFGGYRQSGLGREGGRPAIEAYTEIKTVLLPFTEEMI